MTIDPSAVAVTLMTQEVEHQQQQQQGVAALEAAEASNHEDVKPKGPGSTRRGKQYKCGNCHELGHNQKTCPRRQSAGNEAQTIQPALDASELFSGVANSVAPPLASGVGNGHHAGHGVPITRLQPAKLEAALEAANKRVIAADKAVASATTEQDFDEATSQLDTAVRQFEKVASCAQRCAAVAQTLSGGWDINASPIVERESKRMRIDSGAAGSLTPTAIALNEATTGAAAEAVDASEVVAGEAKDEGLE